MFPIGRFRIVKQLIALLAQLRSGLIAVESLLVVLALHSFNEMTNFHHLLPIASIYLSQNRSF
jgi:hypothetical protein